MENIAASNIYGSFFLDELEMVINVNSIQEVVNFPAKLVAVPLAPDFLIGVFNLRGLIIPVINLKKLLKFGVSEINEEGKVAIVEHQGVRVGLLFDKTSEIVKINQDLIDNFHYAESSHSNVIKGALKLNDGARIIQLIDPFAVVNMENIPLVSEHQKKHLASIGRAGFKLENRKKCISFSMGNLKMAFDISGINEIVKVEEICQSTFETEICLGIIKLRGQVVPIINFQKLIGMDQSDALSVAGKRIIIFKLDQELFGLLVDSVESISTYLLTEIMPFPLFEKNRASMFLGCILIEEQEILLLNHSKLLSNEEIVQITHGHGNLYKIDGAESNKGHDKKKIIKKEAYISFKLNQLFGVPISDVREIINFPAEIVCPPGMPALVLGVLNLRGEMITIIDTRILYGIKKEKQEDETFKILIFLSDNEKFGLVVDSVETIVTVDSQQKIKVPSLIVQQISSKFNNDIKEIISVPIGDHKDKDGALVILNMVPVTERIKKSLVA